jgi:amino-acid N-acetyltransferase
MNNIYLRQAIPADLPEILKLISENNLPVSDILPGKQLFVVAEADKQLVGCAGLELYGESGLFRSLAVRKENRNMKTGRNLLDEVIAVSRENAAKQLYLLTTTADLYFNRMGWQTIERTEVPEELRATTEFLSVCPSTAICMMYLL